MTGLAGNIAGGVPTFWTQPAGPAGDTSQLLSAPLHIDAEMIFAVDNVTAAVASSVYVYEPQYVAEAWFDDDTLSRLAWFDHDQQAAPVFAVDQTLVPALYVDS